MSAAQDHFMSIAMMIDDLRAPERDLRLTAMRALTSISGTLGPDRTRQELIPYITDYLDDDDEVLQALAAALGIMLRHVGGLSHVANLLTPLELLAGLDEVLVRDEAVASLTNIAKNLFPETAINPPEQSALYIQMVRRLAENGDSPHSRCSACGLIAAPLRSRSTHAATKKDLAIMFTNLCGDEEAMVRRAACVALGTSIAPALEGGSVDFMPNFNKFCRDSNDSVKLQAVTAAVALTRHVVNGPGGESHLVTITNSMRALSSDSGWRVRYMLADKLAELCGVLPPREAQKTALPIFRALVKDNMPEIRAACVYHLDTVVRILPLTDTVSQREAIDDACKLHLDPNPHVRNNVASTLLKTAKEVPKELWVNPLIPTCKALLNDSDSQVRLGLVTGFSAIATGSLRDGGRVSDNVADISSALIPVVVSLAQDTAWRVREAVVEQLPGIIRTGGSVASAGELVDIVVTALCDRVATIRFRAAQSCRQLVSRLGHGWAQTNLYPRIFTLSSSRNFQHRASLLHAVGEMVEALDAGAIRTDILPLLTRLAADPVGNVRMIVARVVRACLTKQKLTTVEAEMMVSKFRADQDADVREAIEKK